MIDNHDLNQLQSPARTCADKAKAPKTSRATAPGRTQAQRTKPAKVPSRSASLQSRRHDCASREEAQDVSAANRVGKGGQKDKTIRRSANVPDQSNVPETIRKETCAPNE
ncbi:hypothetical protein CCMA1212_009550 [Trichoderma ghanense]|uniref:Uncharacterized protein n=1 Tax=Trichoderma ghanense TaxID=65468 RepID=A0ABY2GSY0_9HYPO